MAAYLVANIEINDPNSYEEYRKRAGSTLASYGGEFLVRGGKAELLEGEWVPKRVIIVKFDSLEKAKAWWSSREYEEPKQIRQRSAHTQMVVVEGIR